MSVIPVAQLIGFPVIEHVGGPPDVTTTEQDVVHPPVVTTTVYVPGVDTLMH
jgi:hypothetical protein